MARVKNLVRLVFALGAAWMVLEPVVHSAPGNPVAWLGPALAAVVVIVVGGLIADVLLD